MFRFRCLTWAMLVALVLPFPAGCGNSRTQILRDPVARSGASSEEIWYREGGARPAYTAVARPRHLYVGEGGVPDPALYEPAPETTRVSPKKRPASKPRAAAPKKPDCPPCPPAAATQGATQDPSFPADPASSAPAQAATGDVPPLPSLPAPPGSGGGGATPAGSPPARMPLPNMPAAAPAPATPNAPVR